MAMIQFLVGVGQRNGNLGTAVTVLVTGTGRIGVKYHVALMCVQHVDGKYTNNTDKSSHVCLSRR